MNFKVSLSALMLFWASVAQNSKANNTLSEQIVLLPTNGSDNIPLEIKSSPDIESFSTYPKANLLHLKPIQTQPKETEIKINKQIQKNKLQLSTPVQSFEKLFSRLPSKTELYQLANTGDIVGIQKTLQVLASDSSIPCETKITYIIEVLSNVKMAIQQKSFASNQLQVIIGSAKTEINRLQDEIERLSKERRELQLSQLNNKINDLIAQLQGFYDKINALKVQIPPQQARIAGFLKQIDILSKQNRYTLQQINNDNLILIHINHIVLDIQNKLIDAKDLQARLLAVIQNNKVLVKENDNKIQNIRIIVDDMNQKIRNLHDKIDSLQKNANTLQIDLERARTQYSVAGTIDELMNKQINDFQSKISKEQSKLVDDDLKKIRDLIRNLNISLPQIQNSIDRQYYYCYGDGKFQIIKTGNSIVYVVKGDNFGKYIQNVYGKSIDGQKLRKNQDYKLQIVNQFSQAWVSAFGYPLPINSVQSQTTSDSFSCLNIDLPQSGIGKISSVEKNVFIVKDYNGKQIKLNVGICSRIETTANLPKVGQNIAWKGQPSTSGSYNIYSVTCW